MAIEIKNFKRIDKGALQGSFSIYIPEWELTINDVTYFVKEGRRWISFPSREYEKDGEKKYWPFIKFPKERMEAFTTAVIAQIDKLDDSATPF